MAFVKLDTGILDSTLWIERECREVFITALLLAVPYEATEPMAQIEVRTLSLTGYIIPAGWYGFVHAAGAGILRRAMVEQELGMIALEKLGAADPESRSSEFDGRRLVRVDGGYVVLNFIKYREKDATGADRARRWRERQKMKDSSRVTTIPSRVIRHQAEAEAEAEVEKNKNKARSAFAPPVWIPTEAWNGFEAMRVKMRKPMTDRARGLIVTELEKLKARGFDPVDVLGQSERNGWQDVFPIKDKAAGRKGGMPDYSEAIASIKD